MFERPAAVVIVSVADPDLVGSFCEVAVIVTCAGAGTVAGAVYKPVLEIVPFALPPATLQFTAVLNVCNTVAVICCVVPTTRFTPLGATLTEITRPAVPLLQPASITKTATIGSAQTRLMKVPTGSIYTLADQNLRLSRRYTVLPKRECLSWLNDHRRHLQGLPRGFHDYSKSLQFAPTPISTTKGTASLCTFSISSRTSSVNACVSLSGASKSNSSCTCKIIFASNFSFASRASIEIIASLIKSAAVPCSGEFSAVRSAKLRSCTCGELISGIGRMRPNKVFAISVFRVSARELSRYSFTPRYRSK